VSSKYEFIDGEKANYPLTRMFEWAAVSKSGFYEWRGRPASATAERRELLAALVQEEFDASDETYGYRRIHAQLGRRDVAAGPELVRSIMRELDLVPCQPRPYRVTTITDPDAPPTPDRVGRDFTAEVPGTKLVGDITYIPTWQGWLYLATVIDCHTKAVVGWSMADHMRASLVGDAIKMACGNIPIEAGCIFHSDRGTQYTSHEFRALLDAADVLPSVGRTGVCWDNAMAESFFAALKNELVHRTVFPTREHARRAVTRYIEVWYNRRRLHSGIGYRTPQEVYEEYLDVTELAAA
jgi:transposase InsO family protein